MTKRGGSAVGIAKARGGKCAIQSINQSFLKSTPAPFTREIDGVVTDDRVAPATFKGSDPLILGRFSSRISDAGEAEGHEGKGGGFWHPPRRRTKLDIRKAVRQSTDVAGDAGQRVERRKAPFSQPSSILGLQCTI